MQAAIVFDLDGTLIDSARDITVAFQQACSTTGLLVPEDEHVQALIGRPLREMFHTFHPEADMDRLVAAYRAYYDENCTVYTQFFPGVLEVLRTLRERGYPLAVATTKFPRVARLVSDKLGLTPHLDHVQGTEGFAHKPEPDVIFAALEALGGEGLWMVGDTTADVLAGKAAGLKTYAVTWGTHNRDILETVHPDVIADSLEKLLELCP
ncbi:HAD family hydrolase [Deinococcus cellulosilyticus]|uniref:Phosphoglycolate phosphatase n=1 Tax=Deinococcus cellulosilyticus (strain DSM 18568 / NBRC 106333 / KACC 11606 / 5516J-15) TaxID=1223518 RepID=A0A511N7F0_DEIC1|nr:HAD-IA family hydrolase [Deinococcus cellulosilyticus]GEM48764.1 phosphoglycolate phosphatase [Deinococcus cellulosilyticus NBRC 106333 = KACC 11606]